LQDVGEAAALQKVRPRSAHQRYRRSCGIEGSQRAKTCFSECRRVCAPDHRQANRCTKSVERAFDRSWLCRLAGG